MIGVMGVVAGASLVKELRQKYVLKVFKTCLVPEYCFTCFVLVQTSSTTQERSAVR